MVTFFIRFDGWAIAYVGILFQDETITNAIVVTSQD